MNELLTLISKYKEENPQYVEYEKSFQKYLKFEQNYKIFLEEKQQFDKINRLF
jgi:hypothetical protein